MYVYIIYGLVHVIFCYVNAIKLYMLFCELLPLPSQHYVCKIHPCWRMWLQLLCCSISLCEYTILYQFCSWTLGNFWILAVTNNAAVNILEDVIQYTHASSRSWTWLHIGITWEFLKTIDVLLTPRRCSDLIQKGLTRAFDFRK